MQPVLLVGFEESAVAALDEQHFDLIRGVDVAVAGSTHSRPAQHCGGRPIHQGQQGPEHGEGPAHRQHGGERDLCRQLEGEGFRHELAEHHLRDGQRQEHGDGGC